mgnify:CR=1 FL=1
MTTSPLALSINSIAPGSSGAISTSLISPFAAFCSLLKYSFGEARQNKGAVLVDIDGSGKADTTFIPFTPRHDVRVVEGAFADILKDASVSGSDDYLLFRLTDIEPILDGMAMALETPNRQHAAASDRSFNIQQTTEAQLFSGFAKAMQDGKDLTDSEQQYVDELWEQLRRQEGDGLL